MAPNPASNLCTSTACLQLAADMKQSMALNYTEIDPCEDFEQYACGNWAEYHDIPQGANAIYGISASQEQTYILARRILEDPYPTGEDAGYITVNLTKEQTKADKRNLAKIQEAYQVCQNYTALEEQGLDVLSGIIETIVELYTTDASNTTTDSSALEKTLAAFESFGIGTFQQMFISQNEYDPEEVVLGISPPLFQGLKLPDTKESEAELVEITSALLRATYPSGLSNAAATELAESLHSLQMKLVLAWAWSLTNEASDIVPAGNLKKLAPNFDYEGVIKQLAPKSWKGTVNTRYPSYFTNVSGIISQTPAETVQAYFVWKMISSVSSYIEHDLTNTYNDFQYKLQGKDPESLRPRWNKCITLLDQGVDWIVNIPIAEAAVGPHGLTWILTRFFVDKNFGPDKIKIASDMVDYIKDAFSDRIKTREWATEKVKKAALEKVKAMQKMIGLPTDPNPLDPIAIEKYYSDIEIKPSLVLNALAFAKSRINKQWKSLAEPYSRGQLVMSTLKANAYYAQTRNEIGLLAGYLQAPIFDPGYPDYINYGGAGNIVGHEITHGFDSQGYMYDKTGNKTSWWDKESEEAFVSQTKCFVEQYSNFTIEAPDGKALPVNGSLTLPENIADAGGVVSGFAAWKKQVKDRGMDKSLPGFEKFSHEQLFFLKWGQTWCSRIQPEYSLELLTTDVHAPSAARALLPLKNSAEFNKAFSCPNKSPVCEVW
ncbi:endothelin-converting enzyme 2 [Fusarium sporotrichioides]|uniref:Endothelin-converting enzyme 2 n=1 Tax=Fusarium sporotrichioides TaxID=5514 RepID=A0A395RNN6_FUSSP|nr:endothelin-converting enzyme 2 [Fusarium sporotrichioides]